MHVVHAPTCSADRYLHVVLDGEANRGVGVLTPAGAFGEVEED